MELVNQKISCWKKHLRNHRLVSEGLSWVFEILLCLQKEYRNSSHFSLLLEGKTFTPGNLWLFAIVLWGLLTLYDLKIWSAYKKSRLVKLALHRKLTMYFPKAILSREELPDFIRNFRESYTIRRSKGGWLYIVYWMSNHVDFVAVHVNIRPNNTGSEMLTDFQSYGIHISLKKTQRTQFCTF